MLPRETGDDAAAAVLYSGSHRAFTALSGRGAEFMISVGRRVQEAIDHMGHGERLLALTPACIALDVTSQRHAGLDRSSGSNFKRFVQDNLWLITYVGFPGLMASTVRVPFAHPDVRPDSAGCVGIEDIIYHVIRCSLIHSDENASMITWNNAIALGLDQDGNLVLNNGLIWGLVSAVVFSPVNTEESVPDQYWLQVGSFRMFISELWGRIDLAKRFVKFHTGVDVP